MKEIYDWVRWFQELARNIAEGGKTYLIERANQVEWGKSQSLIEFGDEAIDPLSFFYFLASKATRKQVQPVYDSVSGVFEIESPRADEDVLDSYIIPTPTYNFLFHDGQQFSSDLLWNLFRDAIEGDPTIDPDIFKKTLDIKGVGVVKLTHTLFILNPEYFLPVDNLSDDLSELLGLQPPSELRSEINMDGGYRTYLSALEKLKAGFPGCHPYEINIFLYLIKPNAPNRINVSGSFYQISTNVFDPERGDYWEDRDGSFEENNWVYTGGPGPGKSWDEDGSYPLTKPARGDIILVRTGRQRGRAIGIVQKNDYAESGMNENSRIHVLWINKSDEQLSGFTAMIGFSGSGDRTTRAFEGASGYSRSFELIGELKGDPTENESIEDQDATEQGEDSTKNDYPLNQILYGPPGTGKTWNTVDYAMAIIQDEPLDVIERMERKGKLQRFDELRENGQIEMVTFHQNYNYEDFIEGIRPVLSDDIYEEGKVEYELSRGVFRGISERALDNRWRSGQAADESWNLDDLLQAFAEWIDDSLDSEERIDLNLFDRKSGTKRIIEVIWSGDDTFKSVLAGTEGNYRYLTRNVIKKNYKAFCNGEIKSKEDIKPTRNSKKPQHDNARYYFALFQKIKEFHDKEWQPIKPAAVQRQIYVLIIDEINRGNIAKIFGELITLIEESKRIGGDDQATVTLPYSKEEFGVPDNLYIIGTMNTADRSIALLDTALRRRFDFIEMMPDSKLVSGKFEGVDCRKLLEAINKRIRFLLDRERQIGHTYFMNIHNLTTLKAAFKNKIIPLLQEYFYDNWEKIDLVLNRNGFIQKIHIESSLFKDSDLIDDQSESYELLPVDDGKWQDSEQYQKIYENDKQGDAGES